jgi:DNA polymerase-3 subunit beta
MKFEAEKDQLLKSITIADSIITSKNVNTVLSNCLFNVSTDGIEIISTDNEIGIKTDCSAKADGNFSFTVNGKRLASIIKEIPKGDVIIEVGENFSVNVKNKGLRGNYSLVGMPRGEFPDLPSFVEKNSIEIEQSVLKDVIRKVAYAAATDSIKPSFCGVYFLSEEKGSLTSVATDSKRLSLVTIKINSEIQIDEGVIIPLKTINEVSRLLSSQGKCSFSIGKNQCFFRIGDTEVISRLVDGQFPNYKQVIPKEYKMKVVVEKSRLIEALRRVMIFTREPAYKIVLYIHGENMKIEAKTKELGEAEEEIRVNSNTDDKITIGLSAQYFHESIKEIDTEDVELSITSNISPLMISPKDSKKDVSVIMPIQIKTDTEE